MEIKKFEDFINEAFGSKETSYGRRVKNELLNIICDVNHISEKDFKRYDILKDRLKTAFLYNPEMDDSIRRFEKNNSRPQHCAEHIYEWFIKGKEIEKNI